MTEQISDEQTELLAYSPAKFAALFGKSQTWAYRKIYSGQIKVIKSFGNMMIPASEIQRILNSADYDHSPKSGKGRGRPAKSE